MLHIRKLCVGVESPKELVEWQKRRLGEEGRIFHRTRNTPKRQDEILQGGSLYWIIRGRYALRQKITDFVAETVEEVMSNAPEKPPRPHCLFILQPKLVAVLPRPHSAFQGWRYLTVKDAPPDLSRAKKSDDLDPDMIAELREVGIVM